MSDVRGETKPKYFVLDVEGTDQLKVLYDVRLREIEKLTKELDAEKEEKDQIRRKLALCEHDKKNLEISLNANKTLLGKFTILFFIYLSKYYLRNCLS